MQGLMKNNHYKIISTFKLIFLFMVVIGIAVVVFAKRNTDLLTVFSYLSIVGISLSTAIGLQKNNTGKWRQYMLTLPVRRNDIIKSEFFTQALALLTGIMLTGIVFSISFAIYGFLFYRHIDTFLIFSSSTGISLFMSALFFPFSYSDTKDRIEVIGIFSLLAGIGIVIGLISTLNIIYKNPSDTQLILMGIGILIISIALYIISYFVTLNIFRNKEDF